MFEYLKGFVSYKKPEYFALDVHGVAYRVYISLRMYEKIELGQEYQIYIYNHIREGEYKLIGFLEEKERKLFELLLSVKGIGISLALAALSTYSVEQLVAYIQEEKIARLKKIPKLGEKKAQQMILDIQSKVKHFGMEEKMEENSAVTWAEDIASALENLGYAKKEIEQLLQQETWVEYQSLEEAMKGILKKMKQS
ncbi:Holliday junction DNA helicase RuvA [Fusobacterium necrophorum subsp. funduliforme ATCC 51357]|uniref:Holliday junction branch migration complex subunit RuvA n=1 Tax=Fusobacterium necrophorum subsp. funduliforme TaxID=143387 RepID=A0A162JGL8_9FUSO|nr:Holliday junction branch migration protein RuvA [Fusobacterium necrophorum]AYV93269.1 Holliday junction branch migration protein RuvA [Fusobacterium necrophorum subsp. funduliforme]EIJ71267.1 Holliday junction DNA helicase RuvA [Fusobacterium necrophorum subsp. funduliforme ATCC 51357]KAB0554411.1 Holliday junction branch migration protein RuvA [Fusobacterium necrophorum subsp. funduliforme]KYL05723.1 Holliday junction ATP-dependent DNA helicase RuvA [Fusobacterium necrophorum subsp. funduli